MLSQAEALGRDLTHSFRLIRRSPGFTATIVLTLALGIGATTAVFTVVNGVLLRPLSFPESNRLVFIAITRRNESQVSFAYTRYYPGWKRAQTLSGIAGFLSLHANFSQNGEPERITCGVATESLLPLLGVQPMLGRNFLRDEDRPGAAPVAVLGNAFWKRRFGGAPSAVGKTMVLDDRSFTIVGVLPANFEIPDRFGTARHDVWVPFAIPETGRHSQVLMSAVGRLKPGVGIAAARSELDSLLQPQLPKGFDRTVAVVPWHEQVAGRVSRSLILFLVAVACVLLIACVNVANLLLSRAASREKEIAVRRALGAGRGRIVRQLLTETLVLSILGGVLGLALSYWLKDLLLILIGPRLPSLGLIRLEYRVLLFNLLLALVTGIAFGLAPALQASRIPLNETLKDSGRGAGEGRSSRTFRGILAVVEVALAMVLLSGAGLFLQSFVRLRGVDLGFQTDRVMAFDVSLSASRYPKRADQSSFLEQALARIESIPLVRSAAGGEWLPLSGSSFSTDMAIEGRAEPRFSVSGESVSPGYFRTMGIPILRGRAFTTADREGAPGVALVNQSFVRRHLGNSGDLGRRISDPNHKDAWVTIVGVVGDVRPFPGSEPRPEIYLSGLQPGEPSFARSGNPSMTFVVRADVDPMRLVPALREQIGAIDPNLPLTDVASLEQRRSRSITSARVNLILIGSFAALALILGSIGIYGVLSWSVGQRTHEIGVRMAMGAHRGQILAMVLGKGMVLIGTGIGVGALASLGLTRLIASELWGVSARDPWTLAGVAVVLSASGLAACALPARRATRVNPIQSLRCE